MAQYRLSGTLILLGCLFSSVAPEVRAQSAQRSSVALSAGVSLGGDRTREAGMAVHGDLGLIETLSARLAVVVGVDFFTDLFGVEQRAASTGAIGADSARINKVYSAGLRGELGIEPVVHGAVRPFTEVGWYRAKWNHVRAVDGSNSDSQAAFLRAGIAVKLSRRQGAELAVVELRNLYHGSDQRYGQVSWRVWLP